MRSEAGMVKQTKLKRHDGSKANACNGCENECQGVAPESLRQAVPIFDFAFPKRSWRKHLYSTFAIAIINVTILLHRYACKRVGLESEASSLHNSLNSFFRNDFRSPEIQNFLGWHAPEAQTLLVGVLCSHLYAPRNTGNPPCLRP